MDGLLLMELLAWVSLVLVALLTLLTLGMSARNSTRLNQDLSNCLKRFKDIPPSALRDEKTMARWSRIVKQSNSSFWTHVSNRTELKR